MTDLPLLQAFILGVVEGVTEFLPISSTGHLILAGDLLGFNDERAKVFNIAIQTGAMLAVVWQYRARFFSVDRALYRNLIVAFIPAAVLGLALGGLIKAYLFSPVPVALAFIVGGLVILWVDRGARAVRVGSPPGIFLFTKCTTCSSAGARPVVAGGRRVWRAARGFSTRCAMRCAR